MHKWNKKLKIEWNRFHLVLLFFIKQIKSCNFNTCSFDNLSQGSDSSQKKINCYLFNLNEKLFYTQIISFKITLVGSTHFSSG